MVEVDHCGTQESEFKIGPLQNLVKCLDTTYMLQSLFGWRVFKGSRRKGCVKFPMKAWADHNQSFVL